MRNLDRIVRFVTDGNDFMAGEMRPRYNAVDASTGRPQPRQDGLTHERWRGLLRLADTAVSPRLFDSAKMPRHTKCGLTRTALLDAWPRIG